MAHKIPRCIEWVTSIHTLEPGDILATGTNHRGLSGFQNGDVVELETQGLGRLRFNVRDDLKRTWGRETRLDRQNKGLEGTTPQLSGKHTPREILGGLTGSGRGGAGVTGAAEIFAQPVTATSRGLPSKIGLSVVSISA